MCVSVSVGTSVQEVRWEVAVRLLCAVVLLRRAAHGSRAGLAAHAELWEPLQSRCPAQLLVLCSLLMVCKTLLLWLLPPLPFVLHGQKHLQVPWQGTSLVISELRWFLGGRENFPSLQISVNWTLILHNFAAAYFLLD